MMMNITFLLLILLIVYIWKQEKNYCHAFHGKVPEELLEILMKKSFLGGFVGGFFPIATLEHIGWHLER